jgi:uncharacterized metal-binding protein YceD (DUF177 family)
MHPLDRFKIEFGALSEGEHEFQFEVNDKFFEQFEHSPVEHGNIDVLVTVNKEAGMMLVDFTIDGIVTLPCDRCADELELELSGFNELVVKFGDHEEEESEDVIVLPAKQHVLNVAQYIYEYIAVMIPIRNVHPDDEFGVSTCDPETLKELEKLRFHEKTEEEIEPDPRWEILKNINLN